MERREIDFRCFNAISFDFPNQTRCLIAIEERHREIYLGVSAIQVESLCLLPMKIRSYPPDRSTACAASWPFVAILIRPHWHLLTNIFSRLRFIALLSTSNTVVTELRNFLVETGGSWAVLSSDPWELLSYDIPVGTMRDTPGSNEDLGFCNCYRIDVFDTSLSLKLVFCPRRSR